MNSFSRRAIGTRTRPARALRRLFLLAAGAIACAGCALPAGAILGMQAAEAAGVVAAGAAQGDKPMDQGARCDQLESAPPMVAEMDGGRLQSWALAESASGSRWIPNPAAPGLSLAALRFSPPLSGHAANDSRFLVYAPRYYRTVQESEQLTSLVGCFQPASGTFSLNDRVYRYALAKKLPCFPIGRDGR